jgi:hypothetical protein
MPWSSAAVFDSGQLCESFPPQAASLVWKPLRRELLEWFTHDAPSLAPAYRGAVELLARPTFPGRVHFIAHSVRDIADRLVFVLDPQLASRRVQYEYHLDEIQKKWPSPGHLFREGKAPSATDIVAIPHDVAQQVDTLVTEHRNRWKRSDQYELLFRFLMRNATASPEVSQRLVRTFKDTRFWFMSRTHLRRDAVPKVDEPELQQKFEAFEHMLHSFVGGFFTGTEELDEILQQANQ